MYLNLTFPNMRSRYCAICFYLFLNNLLLTIFMSLNILSHLMCDNFIVFYYEVKWSEMNSLSRVQLFATPWTVVCQAPPSMGFSRQEYWSGLPFPSPGDLPNPGIEPRPPALQADSLPSEPPGTYQSAYLYASSYLDYLQLFDKSLLNKKHILWFIK